MFHSASYVVTGDPEAARAAAALCAGCGVDARAAHGDLGRRYPRLLSVAAGAPAREVDLHFPADAMRRLVRVRLQAGLSGLSARGARGLTPSMEGAAVVDGCTVRVRGANDEFLAFLAARFDPDVFRYLPARRLGVKRGSRVFVCSGDSVTFLAAHMCRIAANRPLRVVVTDACVTRVLEGAPAELFDRGSSVLLRTLREIYYRLAEEEDAAMGQALNLADCTAARS